MGMRNMGKLVAMLNPLDQSAVQQVMKANAGRGKIGQMIGLGVAGAKQVMSGGYFQGRTATVGRGGALVGRARGPVGSSLDAMGTKAYARSAGQARQAVGGVAAAWAGLNLMAPDSNLTTLANIGVVGGGLGALGYAKGRTMYSKMMGT